MGEDSVPGAEQAAGPAAQPEAVLDVGTGPGQEPRPAMPHRDTAASSLRLLVSTRVTNKLEKCYLVITIRDGFDSCTSSSYYSNLSSFRCCLACMLLQNPRPARGGLRSRRGFVTEAKSQPLERHFAMILAAALRVTMNMHLTADRLL